MSTGRYVNYVTRLYYMCTHDLTMHKEECCFLSSRINEKLILKRLIAETELVEPPKTDIQRYRHMLFIFPILYSMSHYSSNAYII